MRFEYKLHNKCPHNMGDIKNKIRIIRIIGSKGCQECLFQGDFVLNEQNIDCRFPKSK